MVMHVIDICGGESELKYNRKRSIWCIQSAMEQGRKQAKCQRSLHTVPEEGPVRNASSDAFC